MRYSRVVRSRGPRERTCDPVGNLFDLTPVFEFGLPKTAESSLRISTVTIVELSRRVTKRMSSFSSVGFSCINRYTVIQIVFTQLYSATQKKILSNTELDNESPLIFLRYLFSSHRLRLRLLHCVCHSIGVDHPCSSTNSTESVISNLGVYHLGCSATSTTSTDSQLSSWKNTVYTFCVTPECFV